MKIFRDWRLWAGWFVVVMLGLYVAHVSQRFKFDYAELGRTALTEKGFNRGDLHVTSMTMFSSPFSGDEATVVYQVGVPNNGKRVTVRIRKPLFGPAIVESIQ